MNSHESVMPRNQDEIKQKEDLPGEDVLRKLFENHQDIMLLINPEDGRVIEANPSAVKFYGYSRDTLRRMKIDEINQLAPQETARAMQEVVSKKCSHFNFRHRLAGGEIRTVEVHSSPVDTGMGVVLFSIIHDVTEREKVEQALKKSEELYRSLFANMINGFAYCQMLYEKDRPPDFIYLAVNDAFERLTGLVNPVGKRVSEVIPGIQTTDPELFRIYDRVATGGQPERFEIHLEAMEMWFDISVYCPQKGYFVAVFDVITERKKIEEELKEEARIRTRFIDVLAHELRGPLSPIMMSSAMLKDLLETSGDEKLRKLSYNAFHSTRLLSSRLDELLDVARYSRGAFTLNLRPTDAGNFLEEAVLRFRPVVEQSGQQLIVNIQGCLPVVEFDPLKMEQVLINLLSNASKYSPANTTIEVSAKAENNRVVLAVKDEGKGLSEYDQKNLFRPYFRLEQDRKNLPGLGLGLSICKQIVEAHGGKIEVLSKPGQGSTFLVSLPIKNLTDKA